MPWEGPPEKVPMKAGDQGENFGSRRKKGPVRVCQDLGLCG